MTFRRFAFNNVFRNKRTYAAYFLSSAFSVMVFFVYAIFAFHPDLANGAIGPNVSLGLHFAEGLIYVFSFFFVLYSMSAFLKTRKKEFGLMVTYGMTDGQLRLLVFMENMLIGASAAATGIGAGLVLAKLLLLTAENMLELDQPLPFYWPIKALLLTAAAFLVLFVIISFFTVVLLRGSRLIELIKSGAKPKPEPKASRVLSVLAAVLIGLGYLIAVVIKGIIVVSAMIPVTLMVIVGTYFLFTQLSVYVIGRWKRNRGLFWRHTNLLLLSDLAYRMRDNARTFFMVAILSTVAFSAIGSLVGFRAMMTEVMVKENPFALEYTDYNADEGETRTAAIEQELAAAGIRYDRYRAELKPVLQAGSDKALTVVKASEYNAIAEAAGDPVVTLNGNEAAAIYYQNPFMGKEERDTVVRLASRQTELKIVDWQQSYTLPVFTTYYVVADSLYDGLKMSSNVDTFYAFDTADWKETRAVGERLTKRFDAEGEKGCQFFSLAYQLHLTTQGYGAILFVGLFTGAVFFVAAGSFLYFRLYADLDEDKRKFAAIMKLGLTGEELSKIMTRQLLILFFVPIVTALLHGAVALTSMQRMFGYSLVKECGSVLGVFFLIQVVYFLLIRSRYIRQISLR